MKFSLKVIFVLLNWNLYIEFFGFPGTHAIPSSIDLPDGLLFGAGTSAFQVEGALKSNGKSESFMEKYISQIHPPLEDSPDISSDSYHKFKEDVKVLKYIGLKLYRFSISWPRLLPTGYTDYVNQEGVDYYHALLDELERAGIEPMVQLVHFDHPSVFEKYGGWKNESMVDIFKDYAKFVFEEFGHRIKYFLTFNEPNLFCHWFESNVLENTDEAKSTFPNSYICSNNILKAHAEAYHLYHGEFNKDKKGAISINLLCNDQIVEEKKDEYLIDVAFAFGCGWFAHPIFSKTGDYSDILRKRVKETNELWGYQHLELPQFSESWIKKIRGSADFFAFSYYSSRIVESAPIDEPKSWLNLFAPPEARLVFKADSTWNSTINNNYIMPQGLRSMLKKIENEYNSPPVHLVENGYPDSGQLNDLDRIKFIYAHVEQIINAINQDQSDVRSYIYWSLIDNYEFGYKVRFGLAHIDFDSPNRTRTLKQSATWLRNVLLKRQLFIDI